MDIVTHIENGICNVILRGRFTFVDNPEFRPVLDGISNPQIRQIVFGLEHLEFVDSAGLGMLLLAYDEAEKYSKPIVLRGVNGQVKRILKMARFEQFFAIV